MPRPGEEFDEGGDCGDRPKPNCRPGVVVAHICRLCTPHAAHLRPCRTWATSPASCDVAAVRAWVTNGPASSPGPCARVGARCMVPAVNDMLFPLEPRPVPPVEEERGPVAKTFRPYDPHQILLLPPSLDEWLPERHLARFVSELVEEALDLSAVRAAYVEERGYPPYDPRLMVKLLVYGYCTGQRSSRVIEKRCHDDVAFRYLAAGAAPDFRSIARFRRRHLEALAGLFLQALRLCEKAGMVRLGRVALDGTKLRANARRDKAMSYQQMVKREAQLKAEIDRMLAEAERRDAAEDEQFGPDGRDHDLPDELKRRRDRLQKIQEAKRALEEEARQAAAAKAEARAAKRADPKNLEEKLKNVEEEEAWAIKAIWEAKRAREKKSLRARVEAAMSNAVPKPKAQRNFTDPDARLMKMSDGALHECYNGQAVVDEAYQVIVAADAIQCAADAPSLLPMLEQATTNCGRSPGQVLADAGYCSESNLQALAELDALIATGRWQPSQPPTRRGRRRVVKGPAWERMTSKLHTEQGHADYSRRSAIVEPVFGQMTILQGARHLLLRGKKAATAEWRLLCACHNLRKIFVVVGTVRAGLAPA